MREALAKILELGVPAVGVLAEDGTLLGSVSVDTIVERFRRPLS
jgi:hypothetical protein